MISKLFFEATLIGFLIALPVGPIGVLCINRSLSGGFIPGFLTGLGAATADAVYGCIAVFGVASITTLLTSHEIYIKVAGGAMLCYLGISSLLKGVSPLKQAKTTGKKHYATAFFLTLTNPATIISFTAVFAGLGLGSAYKGFNHAFLMVVGVFTGSILWWIILSSSTSIVRKRLSIQFNKFLNILSNVLILIFGIICIVSTL